MTRTTGTARRAALAAVPLLAALLLAGCTGSDGGGGGSNADSDMAVPEASADERGASEAEDGGAVEQATGSAASEVLLIRTASLTVAAEDVPEAYAAAVSAVTAAGGFVSAESTTGDPSGGGEWSQVTLRVPQERYEGLLADLSALGELVSRDVSTEDVTEEVVDVESRLATQRESVARVRALMEQAVSIGDIVALEAELSSRQAELESLESRSEQLRGQVTMATVVLELREPDVTPAERRSDDEPSIPAALSGGWDVFVTGVVWALATLAALLPFAVATGLVALVVRLVRRRLPARPTPAPADDPTAHVFRSPGT
ncbi:DUF4349 domain-containing protein [Streptomyces avicenniae]|uniref:DUF4349 domain-containing protein n=1 Tax=Streptomyces avicenniae TaxID=500153 RepID=UPI0006992638|nr:DUF4349 domain-containing protein [Streptomyces avicenniae]